MSSSHTKRKALAAETGAATFSAIEAGLPKADIIFITTPDSLVSDMAAKLTEHRCVAQGTIVAHTSGAHSSKELIALESQGAFTASMHPLISFTGNKVPQDFLDGTYFALEGKRESLPALEEVVLALGGIPFIIKTEQKCLYHAAAVVACNYLVAVSHYAVSLLTEAGINAKEALNLLEPLMSVTLKNIFTVGPSGALTGPVERGDVDTLKYHLQEIAKIGNLEKDFYSIGGLYTCKVAVEKNTAAGELYSKVINLFEEALP